MSPALQPAPEPQRRAVYYEATRPTTGDGGGGTPSGSSVGSLEIQLSNDERLKSALHKLVLVLPLTILIFEQALLHPGEKVKLPLVGLELKVQELLPLFLMLISFMLYRALRYARIILWSAMYSVAKTDTIVQIALDETEAYKVNSRYYEEAIDPMVADLLQWLKSSKAGLGGALGKFAIGGWTLCLSVLAYGLIFLMLSVMALYVSRDLYAAAMSAKVEIIQQGWPFRLMIDGLVLGVASLLLLLGWLNVTAIGLTAVLLIIALSLAAVAVVAFILFKLARLLFKVTLRAPLRSFFRAATRMRDKRRDEIFADESASYQKRAEEYISARPDAADFGPRFLLYSAADQLDLRLRRVNELFGHTLLFRDKDNQSETYKLGRIYGLGDLDRCLRYAKIFAQLAPLEFVSSDAWKLLEKLRPIVEAYETSTDNVLLAIVQKKTWPGLRGKRPLELAIQARAKTIPSRSDEIAELDREFQQKDLELFGKNARHESYKTFDAEKVADAYFRQSDAQGSGFAEKPPVRGARDSRIVTYWLGVLQNAVGLRPVKLD